MLQSRSGAGVAQLAERQPSKLHVAGSNPVSRSTAIADASLRLRRAIERNIPERADLRAAAAELSAAYRSGARPPALREPAIVAAYAAARMPATFAAAARACAAAADRVPGFAPATLLDVGGGTGAVGWAARAIWPSIESIEVTDHEPATLDLGRRLAGTSGDAVLAAVAWRTAVAAASARHRRADLVTAGYFLGELAAADRPDVVDALWAATRGLLVLVEPGSRAGFGRILAARERLLAAGARVVAPCPGPEPCPVADARSAWCHFLARLDRSPLHRRAKSGARSWEDEPFSYVAVARPALVADPRPRVVLGRPRHHPGRVELRICADGRIERTIVSRRDGPVWRAARNLEWGDAVLDLRLPDDLGSGAD